MSHQRACLRTAVDVSALPQALTLVEKWSFLFLFFSWIADDPFICMGYRQISKFTEMLSVIKKGSYSDSILIRIGKGEWILTTSNIFLHASAFIANRLYFTKLPNKSKHFIKLEGVRFSYLSALSETKRESSSIKSTVCLSFHPGERPHFPVSSCRHTTASFRIKT